MIVQSDGQFYLYNVQKLLHIDNTVTKVKVIGQHMYSIVNCVLLFRLLANVYIFVISDFNCMSEYKTKLYIN
jgi:hypothetical protein